MRLWELVQGPLYHVGQERQICTESIVRASINAVTEAWTHTDPHGERTGTSVTRRGPQEVSVGDPQG